MKKYLRLFLILICVFCLAGCNDDKKEKTELTVIENSGANTIYIYFPQGSQVKKADEKYQLKQPDSVSASVEEVMSVMSENLGDTFQYHTYMLDADNNVTLELYINGEVSKEYKLLAKAAITETLFQIENVNSIQIKFRDEEGSIIDDGLYLPESFYFYE